jgi:hypothetical protein
MMSKKYIKTSDVVRVNAYLTLTNSMLTMVSNYWRVSSPGETWYYETTKDLMEDVNYNLSELEKILPEEEYKEAFNNDGRLNIW